MSQSFTLFRLQYVDSQLDKARARLQEIDLKLKDNYEINQANVELTNAETNLAEASKSLHREEQEVVEQRIKIEQTESALYGGKIKNPKELQELQNESAALKRYLYVLEDRQLEAMIIHEDAQTAHEIAIKNQATIHSQIEIRNAALENEAKEMQKDIDRIESERTAISSGIPGTNLALYDQIRSQRGGIAVARVIDGTCSACGSTLSSALLNSAQLPNQLSRCSTCSRILYAG
jgi:predicted  nucleic acid-binding Zn-ribbon protein